MKNIVCDGRRPFLINEKVGMIGLDSMNIMQNFKEKIDMKFDFISALKSMTK